MKLKMLDLSFGNPYKTKILLLQHSHNKQKSYLYTDMLIFSTIKNKIKEFVYFISSYYFGRKIKIKAIPVNFLEDELHFDDPIKNRKYLKKIIEKDLKKKAKKYNKNHPDSVDIKVIIESD